MLSAAGTTYPGSGELRGKVRPSGASAYQSLEREGAPCTVRVTLSDSGTCGRSVATTWSAGEQLHGCSTNALCKPVPILISQVNHLLMANPTVLIIGTCNTKLDEILYLREQIQKDGKCGTMILDASHAQTNDERYHDLSDEIIAPCLNQGAALGKLPRGEYIDEAIEYCLPAVKDLVSKTQIQGIVSAAGSSGSSLACALMRKACPVGLPKLMVSTMASGDIKPYIEESDITMMYSVVDIAGLNSILKRILSNAAAAIAAMTLSYCSSLASPSPSSARKRIAVTMFGVTTPCVDHIRRILSSPPYDNSDLEVYVFHATGSGGKAMERLISEGQIDAVIDLTTTEVADELFEGVLTAGPDRLEAAAKKGIPQIISVGACDMVNFGPRDSVPERYSSRNLYQHNPAVTLMRTTKENNWQIGKFIASQLKEYASNPSTIRILLPQGGVSMIDKPNQPFHDPEADQMLFKAIEEELEGTGIAVETLPQHINDEAFAAEVCKVILDLMGVDERSYRLANARRRRWSFDHAMGVTTSRRKSEIAI